MKKGLLLACLVLSFSTQAATNKNLVTISAKAVATNSPVKTNTTVKKRVPSVIYVPDTQLANIDAQIAQWKRQRDFYEQRSRQIADILELQGKARQGGFATPAQLGEANRSSGYASQQIALLELQRIALVARHPEWPKTPQKK